MASKDLLQNSVEKLYPTLYPTADAKIETYIFTTTYHHWEQFPRFTIRLPSFLPINSFKTCQVNKDSCKRKNLNFDG